MKKFKWRFIFFAVLFCIALCLFLYNWFIPNIEVDKKKLVTTINNAKTFLTNLQKPDGVICDTTNSLFNIWETVLATQALFSLTADTNNLTIKKALHFLNNSQNEQMLICHNLKCKQSYCIETSSLYLQLLVDVNKKQTVAKAFQTIANLQTKNGEWLVGNPDVKEAKNFPSVTAFALCALQKSGSTILYENEATTFLMSKQNKFGSWGKTWEFYNIDAYAIWAISQALQYNLTLKNANVLQQQTINFILKSQNKDGSWGNEKYEENVYPHKISPQLETGLTLVALQNFKKIIVQKNNLLDDAIKRGCNFLIAKQLINGSWDGGAFPIDSYTYTKKEYVFATSMAIIALNNYRLEAKN